jgi:hypothetical protein
MLRFSGYFTLIKEENARTTDSITKNKLDLEKLVFNFEQANRANKKHTVTITCHYAITNYKKILLNILLMLCNTITLKDSLLISNKTNDNFTIQPNYDNPKYTTGFYTYPL